MIVTLSLALLSTLGTPVDYVVSVVRNDGQCLFLPTDVRLTAKQLAEELSSYNHANGIVFVYFPKVPSKCVRSGKKAAARAGFTRVTDRRVRDEDIGLGRVP